MLVMNPSRGGAGTSTLRRLTAYPPSVIVFDCERGAERRSSALVGASAAAPRPAAAASAPRGARTVLGFTPRLCRGGARYYVAAAPGAQSRERTDRAASPAQSTPGSAGG